MTQGCQADDNPVISLRTLKSGESEEMSRPAGLDPAGRHKNNTCGSGKSKYEWQKWASYEQETKCGSRSKKTRPANDRAGRLSGTSSVRASKGGRVPPLQNEKAARAELLKLHERRNPFLPINVFALLMPKPKVRD